MKASPRSSREFNIFSLIMILALLAACAGPDGDRDQGLSSDADFSESISLPDYHGFIMDPSGEPIKFATVGGTDVTTGDGVISGDFENFNGQWIPVESNGYATSYAKAYGKDAGSPWFETRMTPYRKMFFIDTEESFLIDTLDDEGTFITAEISAGLFSNDGVVIGLELLDPLDVETRYQDNQAGDGYRLRYAFAIQAFNEIWTSLNLIPGSSIPVTIEFPNPLSDNAVFMVFDPVLGIWVEKDSLCIKDDSLIYKCQLPELNPQWGIFEQSSEIVTSSLTKGMAAAYSLGSIVNLSSNLSLNNPWESESTSDDLFKEALDNLLGWLRDQKEQGNTVDPSDPTLKQLMEDLANAASNFAGENNNESGKSKLGKVESLARANGQGALADQLKQEMGEIADDIGRKALEDANCGDSKKLLLAAEQISRTSKNEALEKQLFEKAKEVHRDCDIFKGTIRFWFPVTDTHPAGLPMEHKGGAGWMEQHDVWIFTNIEEPYEMHGEIDVNLIFSANSFVKRDPCLQEIVMLGTPGRVKIIFEGTFDGYKFSIKTLATDGPGGNIRQTWHFEDKNDEDACVVISAKDFIFSPYYSILVHGIGEEDPPITLLEILNSGFDKCAKECIAGHKEFPNTNPDMGLVPFAKGLVTWNLIHTHKFLPKTE